ncbi:MAG: trimethylamine methyltransferase family protein [Desulfotignum sp.]
MDVVAEDVGEHDCILECQAGALAQVRFHGMSDIPIDADTLALDAVAQAGPGGNLLASQHTFSHFKTELWHSELFDHDNWDKWESKGAKTIRAKALEQTLAMLETEPRMLVTDKQAAAIDAIVDRALQQKKAH